MGAATARKLVQLGARVVLAARKEDGKITVNDVMLRPLGKTSNQPGRAEWQAARGRLPFCSGILFPLRALYKFGIVQFSLRYGEYLTYTGKA